MLSNSYRVGLYLLGLGITLGEWATRLTLSRGYDMTQAQHFDTELHLGHRMAIEFVVVNNSTDYNGNPKHQIKMIWRDHVKDSDGNRTFINADLKLSRAQAHELVDVLIFALDKSEQSPLEYVESFSREEFVTPRPTINDLKRMFEESEEPAI